MSRVNEALGEFSSEDRTWKLVKQLFEVLPGAPPMPFYSSLGDVVRNLGQGRATREHFEAAKRAAELEDIQDVIWIGDLVDKGDSAYAVATGVRSAYRLFTGDKETALENDDQQRNDAILKALALAWMGSNAFAGRVDKKAKLLWGVPSGRHLALYYASIEVALPFADNLAAGGANWMDTQLKQHGGAQFARLSKLAGGKGLGEAKQMMSAMTGSLGQMVDSVTPHVDRIAGTLGEHLPKAADSAAGVAASAADLMPVYRLLSARLAAEAAVMRALRG